MAEPTAQDIASLRQKIDDKEREVEDVKQQIVAARSSALELPREEQLAGLQKEKAALQQQLATLYRRLERQEAAAATAGAVAAECAFTHIVQGGKGKPPIKTAAGTVDLDAVERERGIEIESVAVEDVVTRRPAWRAITSLPDMSLTLEPGKHLYIKSRKPGGPWLIRALLPT